MTKNRYSVLAVRSDADDAIQTTCQNYIPNKDHVVLLDQDLYRDRVDKALYYDAFSKILIKEGDLIIWRWNGTTVAAYPSVGE